MNILNNNCIPKIKTDEGVFASIENINAFANGKFFKKKME